MKTRKRIVWLVTLAVLLSMSACGKTTSEPPEYPELKAVNTSQMELEEVRDSSFKEQYPAKLWEGEPINGGLGLSLIETLDDDMIVSIVTSMSTGSYDGPLEEAFFQGLCDELLAGEYGIETQKSEMLSLNGAPVGYMETVSQVTEEMLDMQLQDGTWTEEMIEAAGGREAFLSIPPTNTIMLFVVADGHIFIINGVYFEEDQKQTVLDAMTVVAQTVGTI